MNLAVYRFSAITSTFLSSTKERLCLKELLHEYAMHTSATSILPQYRMFFDPARQILILIHAWPWVLHIKLHVCLRGQIQTALESRTKVQRIILDNVRGISTKLGPRMRCESVQFQQSSAYRRRGEQLVLQVANLYGSS